MLSDAPANDAAARAHALRLLDRAAGPSERQRLISAVLSAAKAGLRAPADVLADAGARLAGRGGAGLARLLDAHDEAALDLAGWYVDWRRLSASERARQQAARGRGRPPTDRQLTYLRRLGYTGEPPASVAEASIWIDRLLAARGWGARP